MQSSLKALNQVTLSLTQITNFDELVYQGIRQGLDELGFTRLSCWFLHETERDVLVGQYRVDDVGKIIDNKHETIKVQPHHSAFNIIRGSHDSYVVRDETLLNVQSEPIGHGDKAFVPLLDGDTVIGCLYTDTLLDDKPLSDKQIEILNLYGATLGALFNRQRSRQALEQRETEARHFQEQLKQLNQVTIGLSAIDNLDDLTYRAIELGQEKLGFERMGIWFDDKEDPTMRRGMWGTDPDGNIRDERHIIVPIPEHESKMVTEGDVSVRQEIDLYDTDGTALGRGWVLIGVMWDGKQRLGWLYTDSVLTGTSLSQNQLEVFRLYAAQLGLLCAQRIAQDNLRQSEIRYRAITEASSDVIVIINASADIIYVSPSVKYVMDIEAHHVVGQSVQDMIHHEDMPIAEKTMRDCIDNPGLQTRIDDIRIWHGGGHWVHMEAVVTSMIDNPAVGGIVVSCRDITQRRIAEERKRLADRERERSWILRQFISDISHDFRTPLSTIGTNVYLMKRGSVEQIDRRVDTIQQQIERITGLIENMHTIAQLDETSEIQMASTEINSLIESALSIREHDIKQKNLIVKTDLQKSLPDIRGNAQLLHEAFLHIINNAVQFCEDGDAITITAQQNQDSINVIFNDTGVGIPKSDLPHIFDRLYRGDKARNTNSGGGGLGLAITRRIIELHNGSIQINSDADHGTKITIQFPLAQKM